MYAVNNNSGYLSGDPRDYLYMDIGEAKSGNKKWLTYDEMRKRASGEWYDCFTDETCYGYNWDYDMEHFIPAPKEYANATFYNDHVGIVDFYDMFKQYVSYGDYPDFEDDEWWDVENAIVREGEDRYHYVDSITSTPAFESVLFEALFADDELEQECKDSYEPFEQICEQIAWDLCNGDYVMLLRPGVVAPAYKIRIDNGSSTDSGTYYVDADLVWDMARAY